jgi:tRNA(fMet)-specific endonuclease VapC
MPMSGRFLLDTNVVIALLEGETVVQGHLAQADEVFISSIALGELYFGSGKSARPETNRARSLLTNPPHGGRVSR